MNDDPEDSKEDDEPKSHWLLWLIVAVFLLFAIAGMWSIDYFFSPESIASHKVHDAVDD